MFRPTRHTARRGQILIIVLGLLTMLAIIGITFTSYTSNLAQQRRIEAEAQANSENEFPDVGMDALNQFMRTLLYDDQDSGAGLANSGRGYSLMATMYGRQRGATVAWNGVGTFRQALTIGGTSVNRSQVINPRLFAAGGRVYDPEYVGDPLTGDRDPVATPLPNTTYIPKNAPYTYPDIKDLYLAAICPATGEVLVPSFHRDAAFGPLNPNNANWTNAAGKYMTLRPRPVDHAGFPYPQQGPDGRWGDVQNLPGGSPGGFDSIWIDIGAPIVTTRDGRKYKPLVAALIVDLDGRLNLNIHGNSPQLGAHRSGAGIGPWEVSLEKVFAAANVGEARAIVSNRSSLPITQSGMNSRSFAQLPAGGQLPKSAQVPWNGFSGLPPLVPAVQPPGYAGGNFFASDPNYAGGYDWTNTAAANHPALYNPTEWPITAAGAGFPRSFSVADTKLLNLKYAFSPGLYAPMDIGTNFLRGNLLYPTPNAFPIGANTPNQYRLDPAHSLRQIFTTTSNSLDRAVLMPDLNQAQNPYARLGPVDLNRSLADYRNNTALPLSPTNIGNFAAAQLDRQQFAMDIFARLIVATGVPATSASVDTTTGAVTVIASGDNTLRNLAQLAVNMVDYIDSDDISTRFQWNLNVATDVVYGVERPRLVLSEAYGEAANDPADPTFDGTVPTKKAANPAHIRFWIELFNPTSTPYTAPNNGPLGDGSVTLKYTGSFNPYQIEIVRSNKAGTANVSGNLRDPALSATNVTGAVVGTTPDITFDFSPADGTPQAVVAPANGNLATPLSTVVCAANVPPPPGTKATNPEFNPAFANAINAAAPGGTNTLTYTMPLMTILPGGGPGSLAPDLRHHVVLLRRLANPYLPPDPTTNPYITVDFMDYVPTADRMLRGKDETMDRGAKTTAGQIGKYDPNTGGPPDLRPKSLGKVQPYASWTDTAATYVFPNSLVVQQNPTTDPNQGVMHTFTRHNAKVNPPTAAATYTTTAGTGTLNGETIMTPFDWLVHLDRPLLNPFEVLHVTAGKPHDLTQQFITPNNLAGAATDVVKFTGQTPAPAGSFGLGTAAWFAPAIATAQPLYRALDLLRIQPYGQQTALSGRIPGRININTIQDKRVWDALFDASIGNGFTQTDVDNLWNALIVSRTQTVDTTVRKDAAGNLIPFGVPIPGATIHDTGLATGDRPFLPLGTSTVPSGGYVIPGSSATVFAGGIGLDDTLLRRNPAPPNASYLTLPASVNVTHPYQQNEAARKIMNNVTTVSHTFAVWVTVGYFEATDPGPAGPGLPSIVQLGKEYYREAPGDTRYKFFAVVDRSNVGLDPAQFAANVFTNATARPFFTTVEPLNPTQPALQSTTPAGTTTLNFSAALGGPGFARVYSDGVAVDITANPGSNTLVIGEGVNREIVVVQSISYSPTNTTVTPAIPGYATVTLTAPLGRNHYPGECVSNIVPGNPGPQPTFTVTDPIYQSVVPLWSRVP